MNTLALITVRITTCIRLSSSCWRALGSYGNVTQFVTIIPDHFTGGVKSLECWKLSQYPWITVLCNRNRPKNIKLTLNGWISIHPESSSHSSIVQKSSASSAVSGLKRKEMQIQWSMRNIHDSLTILELWLVTIFWLCGLWVLLTDANTPSMVNNGHLKFSVSLRIPLVHATVLIYPVRWTICVRYSVSVINHTGYVAPKATYL